MNRKGFTLVELLGVITILAVIGVIAVISIDGMMEEAQKTECEAIVASLKNAAKEFVSDKRYELDLESLGQLDIVHLFNEGYFGPKVKNPFTKTDVTTKFKQEYAVELVYNDDNTELKTVEIDFIDCQNMVFPN